MSYLEAECSTQPFAAFVIINISPYNNDFCNKELLDSSKGFKKSWVSSLYSNNPFLPKYDVGSSVSSQSNMVTE